MLNIYFSCNQLKKKKKIFFFYFCHPKPLQIKFLKKIFFFFFFFKKKKKKKNNFVQKYFSYSDVFHPTLSPQLENIPYSRLQTRSTPSVFSLPLVVQKRFSRLAKTVFPQQLQGVSVGLSFGPNSFLFPSPG